MPEWVFLKHHILTCEAYSLTDQLVKIKSVPFGPDTFSSPNIFSTKLWQCDGEGRETSHTDTLGIKTLTQYDAFGNVKSKQERKRGRSSICTPCLPERRARTIEAGGRAVRRLAQLRLRV